VLKCVSVVVVCEALRNLDVSGKGDLQEMVGLVDTDDSPSARAKGTGDTIVALLGAVKQQQPVDAVAAVPPPIHCEAKSAEAEDVSGLFSPGWKGTVFAAMASKETMKRLASREVCLDSDAGPVTTPCKKPKTCEPTPEKAAQTKPAEVEDKLIVKGLGRLHVSLGDSRTEITYTTDDGDRRHLVTTSTQQTIYHREFLVEMIKWAMAAPTMSAAEFKDTYKEKLKVVKQMSTK
jgi:hypothetical protein